MPTSDTAQTDWGAVDFSALRDTRWALLACDVFAEELEDFLKIHPHPPVHRETFDVGLHMVPDDMRQNLQARIFHIEETYRPDVILLLFGLCGNAAVGLHAHCAKLVIPRTHECIAMFLGSTEQYLQLKKEKPCLYFCSPGWNKSELLPGQALYDKERKKYEQRYPDDPDMVDELMEAFLEQYKSYNGYLYADFGSQRTVGHMESSRQKAKEMNWTFETMRGNPAYFAAALSGQWDEKRFLTLTPNEKIAPCWSGNILKKEGKE